MNRLETLLLSWPKGYIEFKDLSTRLNLSSDACYSLVKRALKKGSLQQLKKGWYFIHPHLSKKAQNLLELAPLLYGPSYISFKTALKEHQWLKNPYYPISCASAKRSTKFLSPSAQFFYWKVPFHEDFFQGLSLSEELPSPYIAHPIRAIADYLYVFPQKELSWAVLKKELNLKDSLPLEEYKERWIHTQKHYHCERVRHALKKLFKEL